MEIFEYDDIRHMERLQYTLSHKEISPVFINKPGFTNI